MYEDFYGLKENPFVVIPNPKFIYLGENHREAMAHLLYGVMEKKGFIVITGEVGTGKTTLIHYLLHKLSGNNHTKTAFLFNPKLAVDDFIQYILKDLAVKWQGRTKGDHLHALHRYLLDAYLRNEKVILIIDEAQGLHPELLEEIRLLSNLETSTSKLIQIVLVGQPELDKTLSQRAYRQLRQRINMRYQLLPLSEEDTKAYISKRLKIAGAQRPIFTEKALKEIYQRSGGIPRLINILCDNTLLNGYALNRKRIDKKIVKEAARDLVLQRRSSKKIRNIYSWSLIGGMIMTILLSMDLFWKINLRPLYEKFLRGLQQVIGIF